ncbi:8535_t:CDS:1, partial [Scutellospora calospora]
PDPTQNFAFRPSRLHISAIPFGVSDDDSVSDYSEHRRSGLFDVHTPAFQSITS